MATVQQHTKRYPVKCLTNGCEYRAEIDRRMLPGGFKRRCDRCDTFGLHRFDGNLSESDVPVARCGNCGTWTGVGSDEQKRLWDRDRCRNCGSFI